MATKAKSTKPLKKARVLRRKTLKVVRNAVVPHATNHYRPYLIRRYGLAIVLALVILLQTGYNYMQTGSILGQTTNITQQRLLAATNTEREKNGMSPLQLNSALDHAAQAKADDMFDKQYWSHTAPTGVTPWQWVDQAGYQYSHAGENLAKGFHTAQGVVLAWMDSPEHRKNMLDSRFRDVGFAVVPGILNGEQTMLVVALYGTPVDSAVAGASTTPKALAAVDGPLGPLSRIGIGVQSMTPALIGSIVLLLAVASVAVLAHGYRKKLPKQLRQSWYRHHGLYKAAGALCLVIVFLAIYGGGQI